MRPAWARCKRGESPLWENQNIKTGPSSNHAAAPGQGAFCPPASPQDQSMGIRQSSQRFTAGHSGGGSRGAPAAFHRETWPKIRAFHIERSAIRLLRLRNLQTSQNYQNAAKMRKTAPGHVSRAIFPPKSALFDEKRQNFVKIRHFSPVFDRKTVSGDAPQRAAFVSRGSSSIPGKKPHFPL